MRDRNVPPEKWHNYSNIGGLIAGTMFVAFKVPLDERFNYCIHETERFTPLDLVKCRPDLGLVIDLTNTLRYYNPDAIERMGVKHRKVACPGQLLPTQNLVKRFCAIVDDFRYNSPPDKSVVGVHCTHGVNRSGYMICCYMIRNLGIRPSDALRAFESGRGHPIERLEYISALLEPRIDIHVESLAGRLARPPKLCQLNELPEVPSSPESPAAGTRMPLGSSSARPGGVRSPSPRPSTLSPRASVDRRNVAARLTASASPTTKVQAGTLSGALALTQDLRSPNFSHPVPAKPQVPLVYQGRAVHPITNLPMSQGPQSIQSTPPPTTMATLSEVPAKDTSVDETSKSLATEPTPATPAPTMTTTTGTTTGKGSAGRRKGKGSGGRKKRKKESEEKRTVVRLAMSPRSPWPLGHGPRTLPTSLDANAVIQPKESPVGGAQPLVSDEKPAKYERRGADKTRDKSSRATRRSARGSGAGAGATTGGSVGERRGNKSKSKSPGSVRTRSESHGTKRVIPSPLGVTTSPASGGVGDGANITAPKRPGVARAAAAASGAGATRGGGGGGAGTGRPGAGTRGPARNKGQLAAGNSGAALSGVSTRSGGSAKGTRRQGVRGHTKSGRLPRSPRTHSKRSAAPVTAAAAVAAATAAPRKA